MVLETYTPTHVDLHRLRFHAAGLSPNLLSPLWVKALDRLVASSGSSVMEPWLSHNGVS